MGVKATEFGRIIVEQNVGFRGIKEYPEYFDPTKLVGEGINGRMEGDNFGYSVSISGDLAAIGVPFQDFNSSGANSITNAGSVFIARRTLDSWEIAYKISAPEIDRQANANFGLSVSLESNTLVVGAPNQSGLGKAFVYSVTESSFSFDQIIETSDLEQGDKFGSSVLVSKGNIFVASYLTGRNEQGQLDATETGAVWIYEKENDEWVEVKKLIAGDSDRNEYDNFGYSVAGTEDYIIVGVPNYDYDAYGANLLENSGMAYLFAYTGTSWILKKKIVLEDRTAGDKFGTTVAMSGTRFAVAAPTKANKGRVYVYEITSFGSVILIQTLEPTAFELPVGFTPLTASSLTDNSRFGSSIQMMNNKLAIGAPNQSTLVLNSLNYTTFEWTGYEQANAGFVYLYDFNLDSYELTKKLEAADRFNDINTSAKFDGRFGSSISFNSEILAVGEPLSNLSLENADDDITGAGLVHIYDHSGTYITSIQAFGNQRNTFDHFGSSFAKSDMFLAFGSPDHDYDEKNSNFISSSGAVFVWMYQNGSWVFKDKIVSSQRQKNGRFGSKITINGLNIFIQSSGNQLNETLDVIGLNAGSVEQFVYSNGQFEYKARFAPSTLTVNSRFGSTLVSKGEWLFASTLTATVETIPSVGSVYAYKLDGTDFVLDKIIYPETFKNPSMDFGFSIDFRDNILLIGAPGASTDDVGTVELANAGAAFVFKYENNDWIQVKRLIGPNNARETYDYMGFSLATSDNTLVVGVPNFNFDLDGLNFVEHSGKVNIYNWTGNAWQFKTSLVSPNREINGFFGFSVAIEDDTIIVGAPGENHALTGYSFGYGRAYVYNFRLNRWTLSDTLENTEDKTAYIGNYGRFGWKVLINNSLLAISEPLNCFDENGLNPIANAGAVWTYEKKTSGYKISSKLTAGLFNNRQSGRSFGMTLALKDNLLLVGTPREDLDSNNTNPLSSAGAVYSFTKAVDYNGDVIWVADQKIAGSIQHRNASDLFGTKVASNGTWVAVSAPNHRYDESGKSGVTGAGAVFVYEIVNGVMVYRQKVISFDNNNRVENMAFGTNLVMNSTHLIVSAPNFTKSLNSPLTIDSARGRVWTYKFDNGRWLNESILDAEYITDNDGGIGNNYNYGTSLSLDENQLAIGAPGYTRNSSGTFIGQRVGCVDVYKFENNTWTKIQTILPIEASAQLEFGRSVTLKSNMLLIGGLATGKSTNTVTATTFSTNGGAAWLYENQNDEWNFAQKLTRGEPLKTLNETYFGYGKSISFDGSTLIVGAPNQTLFLDDTKLNAGAAWIFEYQNDELVLSRYISAPDKTENALFGSSVFVKDDLIAVGAPGVDTGTTSGDVYIFRKNASILDRKIKNKAKFEATGASQTFTVPDNITELTMYLWGASGAGSADNTSFNPGKGAWVKASIDVTPGEELTINVGTKPTTPGAGGGRTEILRGTTTLLIAGAGGGNVLSGPVSSTFIASAGSAGAKTGMDGLTSDTNRNPAGKGASETYGGVISFLDSNDYYYGSDGQFKQGGSGPTGPGDGTVYPGGWPNGGSTTHLDTRMRIAGGGDGYFGGSSGAHAKSGSYILSVGGGGSSFVAPGINGIAQPATSIINSNIDVIQTFGYQPGIGNSGAVLIEWEENYQTDDWTFEQKLSPSYSVNGLQFGSRLVSDGATLAIVAAGDYFPGQTVYKSGSLFVFEFDGISFVETAALKPFNLPLNIYTSYGASLALHEDVILVGDFTAIYDSDVTDPLVDAGVVYVYRKISGVWKNWSVLTPPGDVTTPTDRIGQSILQEGDYVFVGAPNHRYDLAGSGKKTQAGAVYIWKWISGTLTYQTKLVSPSDYRVAYGQFGYSLSYSNGELIVGQPGSNSTVSNRNVMGKVFTFALESGLWTNKQVLSIPYAEIKNGSFGWAIDSTETDLVVGAPDQAYSALQIDTNIGINYTPLNMALLNTNNDWALELGFYKFTGTNTDIFQTKNYKTLGFNSFALSTTSSNQVVVNVYNGTTLDVQMIASSVTTGWHIAGLRKNGGNYEFYIDGVLIQTATLGGGRIINDIANGFSIGSTAVDNVSSKRVDFLRITQATVSLTTPQNENIGMRPGTVFFADYANFATNNSYNDLTGNYIGTASTNNNAYVYAVPGFYNVPGGQIFTYVRENNSWTLSKSIIPQGANASNLGDRFGNVVKIQDDLIVASAPNQGFDQDGLNPLPNSGAAWIFQKQTNVWTQIQKLVGWGQDANVSDQFGFSVISHGPIAAISAPSHAYDQDGNNYQVRKGAVYIWENEGGNWLFRQKLSPPASSVLKSEPSFGYGMALNDDMIVIGDYKNRFSTDTGNNNGSAYVWMRDKAPGAPTRFINRFELIPTGTQNTQGGNYGFSVAINDIGDIIIGSPTHSLDSANLNPITDAGAAYIFRRVSNNWTFLQKIVVGTQNAGNNYPAGSVRNASDQFGYAVTGGEDYFVIGSPYRDLDGYGTNPIADAGGAYVFKLNNSNLYEQVQVLTQYSSYTPANFYRGSSVSTSGSFYIVGNVGDAYNISNSDYKIRAGAVEVWKFDESGWHFIQKLTAELGSTRIANGYFGASVKVLDDLIIVGHKGATVSGITNAGEVLVYKWNGLLNIFEFYQNIQLPTPMANDQFGYAVDFDGNHLLASGFKSTIDVASVLIPNRGKVAFFNYDSVLGFSFEQLVIETETGQQNDNYGYSVLVKDGFALVGQPRGPVKNDTAVSFGSVIVYEKNEISGNWEKVNQIWSQRPTRSYNERYGAVMASWNDYMAVSAPNAYYDHLNRNAGIQAGAVYLFKYETGNWVFKQKITPIGKNQINSYDYFGTSLMFSETGELFVGSPGHQYDINGNLLIDRRGAVYSFKQQEVNGPFWQKQRIVLPNTLNSHIREVPDGVAKTFTNDFYAFNWGTNLKVKNGILLVGATSNTLGGSAESGKASLFSLNGLISVMTEKDGVWELNDIIFPFYNYPQTGAGSYIGNNFGFDGNRVVAGIPTASRDAQGRDTLSENTGVLDVFDIVNIYDLTVKLVGGNYIIAAEPEIVIGNDPIAFDSIDITYGGVGYTAHPEVEFSQPGFTGYANLTPTTLNSAILTRSEAINIGAITVTVVPDQYDTTGSGAEVVLKSGAVKSDGVTITNGGSGYTTIPVVTLDSTTSTFDVKMAYTGIETITTSGTIEMLDSYPTVVIDAPSDPVGIQAVAQAVLEIQEITLQNTTSSYVGEQFNIVLNGTNALIETTSVDSSGNLATFDVISFGEFYAPNPFTNVTSTRVVVSENYGSITESVTSTDNYGSITEAVTSTDNYGTIAESTATFTIKGKLKSIQVTDNGAGYETYPTVSLTGYPELDNTFSVIFTPTEVASVTALTIDQSLAIGNYPLTFTGGSPSITAVATIAIGNDYGVLELDVINPGSGYTRTPRLVFSDAGFAAEVYLTPTSVESVTMLTTDPTLTITKRSQKIKRIVPPVGEKRAYQRLGNKIFGSNDLISISTKRDERSGAAGQSINHMSAPMIYKINKNDRFKDRVEFKKGGWLDLSSAADSLTGDFTISLWFNFEYDNTTSSPGCLFTANNPSDIGTKNSNMVVLDRFNSFKINGANSISNVGFYELQNGWSQMTYTRTGSIGRIYINGNPVHTFDNVSQHTPVSLIVGKSYDLANNLSGDDFVGLISSIKIWNIALTEEEILFDRDDQIVLDSNIVAKWL